MVKIGFHGAAGTVTGSRYLLEASGAKALVDCGFFQGKKEIRDLNWDPMPCDTEAIDFVILTHAHLDHSGLLPRLVSQGFRGPVYCTPVTASILPIMWRDAAHIIKMEWEWRSRKYIRRGRTPRPLLYTQDDVETSLGLIKPVPMDETTELWDDFFLTYRDAGHIFGAAHAQIDVDNGTRIVFSGDIGQEGKPFFKGAYRFDKADAILVESTYGNRLHRNLEDSVKELEEAILYSAKKKGKVLIPSFALGRTQEMLFYLNGLVESGKLKDMPVFVDSPMATAITEVIKEHPEKFEGEAKRLFQSGDNPLAFPGLTFTRSTKESMKLNHMKGPAVIISASGMCTAGRILHHLKHNLWRPEATVIFVGFQAEGTRGRQIVDGAKMVKLFGEEIVVKAKKRTIGGFSAHADRDELLEWLGSFREGRRRVFAVHGEPMVTKQFASTIHDRLGLDVTVPSLHEEFEI
ncbi:MBL fold metallo-hydrolase RNA specificity domain-containing protein [Acidobacteriota bacterium]